MTKSNGAARQWKIFPKPNLHTLRSIPSPTSTGNEGSEGSVTSVDTEPPRHRHMVVQLNPVLSSSSAELSVYGFTHQRSSTRNSSEGSDEFEWTNSSNPSDVKKKKRLNVSSTSSKCSHGRETEEWDPAHEIEAVLQAAAALVELWSDETPCQSPSSSSSAGEVSRRSWSSPKTTTDRLDSCGETLLRSGETRPEDAMAASVLSKPCNKRRYRMMVDLLAETATVLNATEV